MSKTDLLTLKEAIEADRIQDFISQEVKRGIGPANEKDFADAIAELIKPRQSEDQTSHSPSRGGSRGK